MAIVFTVASALVVWVILFSIRFNSFVALLIAMLMVLLALTGKMLASALPSRSGRRFTESELDA